MTPGEAVRLTSNAFRIRDDGRLYIAKVGDIQVVWSRPLPGAPSSVTVMRDASDRYWGSFVVEADRRQLLPQAAECGIDLGLTHFAVLSDGSKIVAPKFLRRAERVLGLRRTRRSDPPPGTGVGLSVLRDTT